MAVLPLIIFDKVVVTKGVEKIVDSTNLLCLFCHLGGQIFQAAVERYSDQQILIKETIHHKVRCIVCLAGEFIKKIVFHSTSFDYEHHGVIDYELVLHET